MCTRACQHLEGFYRGLQVALELADLRLGTSRCADVQAFLAELDDAAWGKPAVPEDEDAGCCAVGPGPPA